MADALHKKLGSKPFEEVGEVDEKEADFFEQTKGSVSASVVIPLAKMDIGISSDSGESFKLFKKPEPVDGDEAADGEGADITALGPKKISSLGGLKKPIKKSGGLGAKKVVANFDDIEAKAKLQVFICVSYI